MEAIDQNDWDKHAWDKQTLAYLAGSMDETRLADFEKELAASDEGRAALVRSRAVLDAAGGASDPQIARLVRSLLETAMAAQATDLHFEAIQKNVVVRVRVGGVLREQARLPKNIHQSLVDWWKQQINGDLSERRKPQAGIVVLSREEQEWGLRVAVLPQFWGESVHVRLMNRSQVRLGLDALGLRPEQKESLQAMTARSSGLVLTGGPKQSGKTTLLYSLLHEMQAAAPPRHILTIEDPVELTLAGVGQTGVNAEAGLSRSQALRAFLEADPDVIYCSELREAETARLVMEAALTTSCLVLSVIPGARSAWDSVERLRHMGIPHFEIAALRGVIGQRLVRTFAPDVAIEADTPHTGDLAALGLSPAEDGPFLRAITGAENGFSPTRTALFEIVPITTGLGRALASGATPDELWAASCGKTGHNLRDEAAQLVREGRTTAEEAARTIADYPHRFAPPPPGTEPLDYLNDVSGDNAQNYVLPPRFLNQ